MITMFWIAGLVTLTLGILIFVVTETLYFRR